MAEHISKLASDVRCLGRWPDVTMVYFPGPDDVAHFKGPGSEPYRSALRSLDKSLGSILCKLERGGLLSRMTLVLTSDHGMEPVAHGNYVDVEALVMDRTGIAAYGSEVDFEAEAPYLAIANDHPYWSRHRRFADWPIVVSHSGERQASLHFRIGQDWATRPTLDQILWFHRAGDGGRDYQADQPFPVLLLQSPAIGFVVVRDGVDAVQVYEREGVARIERSRSGLEPSYRYSLVSGRDPLFHDDSSPPPLADGAFHGSRKWLDATAALAHPDAVPQLGDLFDSPRLGDVALFAAPCWDFSKKYVGGHGGLERAEMQIPLYFVGPGIEPGRRIFAARQVDLVPTILDLMGLPGRTSAACRMDGKSLLPELKPAGAAPTDTKP
jgi:arylsulfatase A-like enzyme